MDLISRDELRIALAISLLCIAAIKLFDVCQDKRDSIAERERARTSANERGTRWPRSAISCRAISNSSAPAG